MSKIKTTKTVFHPSIAGVTREVEDSDSSKWTGAGWKLTEPKPKAAETTTKEAAKK